MIGCISLVQLNPRWASSSFELFHDGRVASPKGRSFSQGIGLSGLGDGSLGGEFVQ
jgi:hypothetical protein